MNKKLDQLMYEAGLTAQGCWDEMDSYDQEAIIKLAKLIVRECAVVCRRYGESGDGYTCSNDIKEHFGVE